MSQMCLEVAATELHSWLAGFRYESCEHHIEIRVLRNDAITENERKLAQGYCILRKASSIILLQQLLSDICIEFLSLQVTFTNNSLNPILSKMPIRYHFIICVFRTPGSFFFGKYQVTGQDQCKQFGPRTQSVRIETIMFKILISWTRCIWKMEYSRVSEHLLCFQFSWENFRKGSRKCW